MKAFINYKHTPHVHFTAMIYILGERRSVFCDMTQGHQLTRLSPSFKALLSDQVWDAIRNQGLEQYVGEVIIDSWSHDEFLSIGKVQSLEQAINEVMFKVSSQKSYAA